MKARTIFAILIVVSMLITSISFAADDAPLFHRNISRTPEEMTGASQQSIMPLYVPAQNTQGELVTIEYLLGDKDNSSVLTTMDEAKPIVITYNDGVGGGEADLGTGAGFGERDAFAALSLDDGATWKNWNLSDSALRSSFTLKNEHAYPGDVFKVMHAVEGNRVAVAYISRFCESGAPLYSWEPEDALALSTFYGLGADVVVDTVTYNTYASDMFGVSGGQVSVDYTLQGFPEVGEVPYGCVWVARGTLEEVDANGDLAPGSGIYDIIWRASERLTSGRRDANRVEITSAPGAGFIISWQEDPEGLRPGKGLGPGEGWSGAIANPKTDIWYTYIGWDHFDDVCTDDPEAGMCAGAELATITLDTKPKAAVPFAVPMRLTDNGQCKPATNDKVSPPYCYADFDGSGVADFCASETTFTNGAGDSVSVCVTEDGRALTGRTASTRVRWVAKPYTTAVDNDGDGVNDISAWVAMAEEKMKALGDPDLDDEELIDIGKNMWYHTFDMFNPELVAQGLMLNAPAIDHETLAVFPVLTDEWGYELWETEIARRFNLMVNTASAALASATKTSAILIYKEGILNQGGPADIFIRRVVLPDTFDSTVDNPYAYENVECVTYEYDEDGTNATVTDVALLYPEGENPNYVRGLCPVQGMNISGTSIVACDGTAGDCAADFPWLDGEQDDYPKVTEWVQEPANLNDPSWVNPYDVSKGHRGFIDGDFVMMMYATAPNWKANTVGNESYNLYIRRSFDGGVTWTTLPASFDHIDGLNYSGIGTESCEWYGWGGTSEYEVCTPYGPGDFEQARNVSQLTGTRITVLDPRYSPTGGMRKLDYTSLLCKDATTGDWVNCGYTEAPYPEEIRDPSAYFVTYETGDNTVVTETTGTVPLDMYYSRAFDFGDVYDVVEYTTASGQVVGRWDWLENGDDLATEASVYGNPDGSKFYAVWNQELPIGVDEYGEDIFTNMDSEFRRIFYNLTDTDSYPTASILYQSVDRIELSTWPADEYVVLVGTARDLDRLNNTDALDDGITEAKWKDDLQGLEWNERTWKFIPHGFIPGKHPFSFRAKDNEGNWSNEKTVTIWVAEKFYNVYLPTITR